MSKCMPIRIPQTQAHQDAMPVMAKTQQVQFWSEWLQVQAEEFELSQAGMQKQAETRQVQFWAKWLKSKIEHQLQQRLRENAQVKIDALKMQDTTKQAMFRILPAHIKAKAENLLMQRSQPSQALASADAQHTQVVAQHALAKTKQPNAEIQAATVRRFMLVQQAQNSAFLAKTGKNVLSVNAQQESKETASTRAMISHETLKEVSRQIQTFTKTEAQHAQVVSQSSQAAARRTHPEILAHMEIPQMQLQSEISTRQVQKGMQQAKACKKVLAVNVQHVQQGAQVQQRSFKSLPAKAQAYVETRQVTLAQPQQAASETVAQRAFVRQYSQGSATQTQTKLYVQAKMQQVQAEMPTTTSFIKCQQAQNKIQKTAFRPNQLEGQETTEPSNKTPTQQQLRSLQTIQQAQRQFATQNPLQTFSIGEANKPTRKTGYSQARALPVNRIAQLLRYTEEQAAPQPPLARTRHMQSGVYGQARDWESQLAASTVTLDSQTGTKRARANESSPSLQDAGKKVKLSSPYNSDLTETDRESQLLPTCMILKKEHEFECSICLEDAIMNQSYCSFLPCGHKYHSKCISDWLKKKAICPTCQLPIEI